MWTLLKHFFKKTVLSSLYSYKTFNFSNMYFTFILQKNFFRTFFSVNVAQSCKIKYYNKDYLKNNFLSFSLSSFHSILYASWDSLWKNIYLTNCFRCWWFLLFLIFIFINKYPIINISSAASIFSCLAFLKFLF